MCDLATLEKLVVILQLIQRVAFYVDLSAVACGIMYPFFFFSLDRLLPWRKIGPLGCEQVLWCLTSGSSCSTVSEHGQASQALRAALSLGAVALHSSCSLLSRGAVGILGDQRMVLKIKKKKPNTKNKRREVLRERFSSRNMYFGPWNWPGKMVFDLNLRCNRPDLSCFVILLQTPQESRVMQLYFSCCRVVLIFQKGNLYRLWTEWCIALAVSVTHRDAACLNWSHSGSL